MITIYKKKKASDTLVTWNDVFFNKNTVNHLDDRAKELIAKIDRSEMLDRYTIKSRFDGTVLNIDKLSTGCKTVLNVLYNPEILFDLRECGENALDALYSLEQGRGYCDYPMISFDMTEVKVYDGKEERVIQDYETLKEWWQNEN